MFQRKNIDLSIRNFSELTKKSLPRRFYGWLGNLLQAVGLIAEGAAETVQTWNLIGSIAMFAVSIGLTIYSMVGAGGGSGGDKSAAVAGGAANQMDANGQLINTRQASDPIRIVYGIVKTGGTWVFSRASALTNNFLNIIITWGEGEMAGLSTGIDSSPIYSGSTLNDLETGGEFAYAACACDMTCDLYVPCSCNMTCHVYT
jgi:hypothetical protein